MKKILFYVSDQPKLSGISSVLNTVIRIVETENRVHVLLRARKGCESMILKSEKTPLFRLKLLTRLFALFKLLLTIKRFKPDTVVCLDVFSCKQAVFLKNFFGIKASVVSWLHNYMDLEFKSEKTRRILLKCDSHLAISSGIQDQLLSWGCKYVSLIYNPSLQTTEVFNIKRNSSSLDLIFVGRVQFSGQKNLHCLLSALTKTKNPFRLHIIGNGDDESLIKQYAESHNLVGRVFLHGFHESPWNYVSKKIPEVNALVLPSKREGFGLVLIEALKHGIPCVASDCLSGPSDIIVHGINGYLFQNEDSGQLSEQLDSLIGNEFDCSFNLTTFSPLSFYKRFICALERNNNQETQ